MLYYFKICQVSFTCFSLLAVIILRPGKTWGLVLYSHEKHLLQFLKIAPTFLQITLEKLSAKSEWNVHVKPAHPAVAAV